MILNEKTSLGIHITEQHVSFVQVRPGKDGIKLMKASQVMLPEGAVKKGNIQNITVVGKTVKSMLDKKRIRDRRAHISLVAKPTMSLIVDLPDDVPANIGRYVQSEIRHSVVLSGKEALYDYCGMSQSGPASVKRIFVGATDKEKVNALLKVLSIAKVEPISVDLPVISSARAIYKKHLFADYEGKTIFVYAQNTEITICVFRKGLLEFIRTIDLNRDSDEQEEFTKRCCEEIKTVIQFYDIEMDEGGLEESWKILLSSENIPLQQESFLKNLENKQIHSIHIASEHTFFEDTPVIKHKSVSNASLVALGLAMKGLPSARLNINLNMLPIEAEEVKAAKRHLLLTVNAAAAVLLLVVLLSGLVRVRLDRVQKELITIKSRNPADNIEQLLEQQREITHQIDLASRKKVNFSDLFNTNNVNRWAQAMEQISQRTPSPLCIVNMGSNDNVTLSINGYALSYKSIHLFADLLRESDIFESAEVIETNKDSKYDDFVTYTIVCGLISETESVENVDGKAD